MATIVAFHAHPDDEVLTTGGTLARASDAGHRVVLVVATGGELGESPEDLAPDETLAARRALELDASARILGIHAIRSLGYEDSGMADTPENGRPEAFAQADVEEAAARLAAILDEESAAVLTVYDERGNYGHPDHLQVHVVGHRAAALAATRPEVFEATVNRDFLIAMMAEGDNSVFSDVPDEERPNPEDLGMPESVITTRLDVGEWADRKRAALLEHHSQVTDTGFFLQFPVESFRAAFGIEWFIHAGVPRPAEFETELLPDPVE